MSFSVWDTKVLMPSSFLLANIRILSCLFFFFLVFTEKIKVKLELAIPASAPTALADEMVQTPLLVALKTFKILCM